jgi:hypothetical protein
MTSSKNIIFGTVFGLLFIFGGTFVLLENNEQTQNNSEYLTQTNNTGTNTLPVLSSEPQNSESSQSGDTTTGSNLTESQSGLIFHAPNTEWKARTITLSDGRVVTYRFGEGNPEEVAISFEELSENCTMNDKIQFYFDRSDCSMSLAGTPIPTYVSTDVEAHLLKALSSPDWEQLLKECTSSFQYADTTFYRDQEKNSHTLFSKGFLDLESFIRVNLDSGRKVLDHQKIRQIVDMLQFATLEGGVHNTVAPNNPGGDCVDRLSHDIIFHFAQALAYYGTSY